MGTRAFIYTRISQDRGGEGLGVKRQLDACASYAMQHGMDVIEIFSDNSTSAFSDRTRPAYAAMLERLRTRDADAVICWRMDRLHRRPVDFEEYAIICQGDRPGNPVLTYAVTAGGEIDLSTADGLLRAGIMGQIARFESATKRDRARAKSEQLAFAGMWTGGRRPFGWDIRNGRLVLIKREADALAAAHADVLAGRSLGAIIKGWNQDGWDGQPLLTSANKPWGYAQLRQALLRPRNAGLYEFRGEIISRDQIPPVVSEEVWRATVSVLVAPERRRSQSNKAAHLLSGIAQCHCGEHVRSATIFARVDRTTQRKAKHTVYRCSVKGRGHIGKREAAVDAVVELWVFRLLAQSYRAKPESPEARAKAAAIGAELEALHIREREAGGLLASGDLGPGQLREFNESIRRRRAELEQRLTQLGLQLPDATDADTKAEMEQLNVEERFNAWLALPIDDRRDFIRSKFHIVLHPHSVGTARIFDPDTVSVHIKRPGESRNTLTGSDIAALDKVSIGPDVDGWFQGFRENRIGSTYDRRAAQRERLIELAVLQPQLKGVIERILGSSEEPRGP